MCLSTWEVAATETREVLRRAGHAPGHVFNLGHGVLPETDPDILEQVVALVHAEGRAGVGVDGSADAGAERTGRHRHRHDRSRGAGVSGPSGPPTGVLVMAHGTPPDPGGIESFYTSIRRGRPPTPELLAELVGRYEAIGGTSPLAERTRAQVEGVARVLEGVSPGKYTVRYGAKHTSPAIEEGMAELVAPESTGWWPSCSPLISRHSDRASTSAGPRRQLLSPPVR